MTEKERNSGCSQCGAPSYAGCEHKNRLHTKADKSFERSVQDAIAMNYELKDKTPKYEVGSTVSFLDPEGVDQIARVIKSEAGIYLLEYTGDSAFAGETECVQENWLNKIN